MATTRLHPLLYTPTLHPIGQTTPHGPRPPSSYLPFAPSVKVATPLEAEAALAVCRANLFASFSCPSRKLHNTIGSGCSVWQQCCLLLAPPCSPTLMPGHRSLPSPYHITLRQRVQSDGCDWSIRLKRGLPGQIPSRLLVLHWVTRTRQEPPRALYLPEHPHFCFSERRTGAIFKCVETGQ